jgi:hypothetical protein
MFIQPTKAFAANPDRNTAIGQLAKLKQLR